MIDQARRALRLAALTSGGLIGASLVLLLAWVLSNLRDIDPQPRHAALALPAPQMPDEGNSFFAWVGLQAAADRDPAAAGRASWQAQLDFARRPRPLRDPQAFEAAQRVDKAVFGDRLLKPSDASPARASRWPRIFPVPSIARNGC